MCWYYICYLLIVIIKNIYKACKVCKSMIKDGRWYSSMQKLIQWCNNIEKITKCETYWKAQNFEYTYKFKDIHWVAHSYT